MAGKTKQTDFHQHFQLLKNVLVSFNNFVNTFGKC